MTQEGYIKIHQSDFGLIERKYMLSPAEQAAKSVVGIDLIKQDIAAEIGQFLLKQGLIVFKQENNVLIASLYVVKHPKGAQINGDENP